ncbi:MAG: hypothetical protein M1818_001128 [Claussenomyces sp. TS43310]|nr:MAG: hypothetical protein M1818_001128 [Claussenomyces sp. TS43310]
MATEVTSDNFADASTIAESNAARNTHSQDVDTGAKPPVNGKAYIDTLDSPVNSAEVSVNGGSDTEATKAEATKHQGDGQTHARSASTIKKPTSFKAVSVNKTFLAAKGAPGATFAKVGDKGSAGSSSIPVAPSTSFASRPRLVAKTGSGLRDSGARASAAANSGKGGAAPDPSVVWNKNRPAPPPEQKRISDEELKQQYGIHLATRLQSDDQGKQANWADIDDDDEDWAPESIEWTDGTKISLPTAEEPSSTGPKPTPAPLTADSSFPGTKSRSPAPLNSSTSTSKISGMSSISGNKGLILKGASEKPTLIAKPPGPPTPVKSPWASLPPVDKVLPIAIELQQPQQVQQPRSAQHDFDAITPLPAKEIAADDFTRTWRDSNAHANRELFNSQSGRYEPVSDARRASRNDGLGRQPALLQRPIQGDQSGSAEPSAAFQTHRASGQDGSSSRRRASSNISGGSDNIPRRISKTRDPHPSHDMLNTRRGSLIAVSDSPSSPRNFSPSGHHQGQRVPSQQPLTRASPVISQTSLTSTQGQVAQPSSPAIPIEDEMELQRKIMRESRELARKRRLEEEAREEAERKERIRLKLEAMGPAPDSKKSKKDTTKDDTTVSVKIQARDSATITASTPKPPVPEVAGEVQQYGLMKVHPSEPVGSSAEPHIPEANSITPDLRVNGNVPNVAHKEPILQRTILHQPHSQDSRQQWQDSSSVSERYSTWGASPSHPSQGRNVWGPPTNDKTLGNGTFNPELSRLPEIHGSPQVRPSGPGPIGPPNPNRANGSYQGRGREQYGQRPAPIGTPHRQQGAPPIDQQQRAHAKAAWSDLPEQIARDDAERAKEQDQRDKLRRNSQTDAVEPHGPVFKETWRQVSLNEDGSRSKVKGHSQSMHGGSWKDFPSKLARDEATETARNDDEATTRRQTQANGVMLDASQPVYKTTWRQAHVKTDGSRSDVAELSKSINNGVSSSSVSPSVRGSRFFPTRDVRLEDSTITSTRPNSSSPPPPTMIGHPAYDGDSLHPLVCFPRPPPVVKLPPAPILAPIGPPKPSSFAAAVAAPIVSTSSTPLPYASRSSTYKSDQQMTGRTSIGGWQDRINSLIGRKSSPPKNHALAVDSSSKSALDLLVTHSLATVSLPSYSVWSLSDDNGAFETKPMAEECFEEQEMGSLPPIRVPNKVPEAAWHLAAPQQRILPKRFLVNDSTTVDAPLFYPPNHFTIQLPGMERSVIITPPRQKSNPRRSQGRGGTPRHASSNHSRGFRGRDTSGGFVSGLDQSGTASSTISSSRGAGRSRGSGNNSNASHRHASTPSNAINV